MLKLIIICVFLYVFIRLIRRIVFLATPASKEPIELKACEYCGTLVRVDKGIVVHGRLFCCEDHANRVH